MNRPQRIVVVGASLAGLRCAEGLRRAGYAGELVLVGEEPHLPYDRPPLSKQLLTGEWDADKIRLAEPGGLDADFRLGTRAVALRPADRVVVLDSGDELSYDRLVIATGAAARRLPFGHDLDGVHTVRTVDDSLAVRAAFEREPKVVVIGGGFIGAEVASAARFLGLSVALVEPEPAPLARVLGPDAGACFARLHRDNGVHLHCGRSVVALAGEGRVNQVQLDDGTALAAEVVVVGIGATPNASWLDGSGLAVADGVDCDEHLYTGVPGVFAIGDVARFHHRGYGEPMRVGHWTDAVGQAAVVAHNLLHEPAEWKPYDAIPYFWSDQYGSRIQFCGRAAGRLEILDGDPGEGAFSAVYVHDGKVVGALAVNRGSHLPKLRRLVAAREPWKEDL